jgi:hypothetical protein
MNEHRPLPPGDCGMRGVAAGRSPGCGRTVPSAVGLVGGVEDHSSDGSAKSSPRSLSQMACVCESQAN